MEFTARSYQDVSACLAWSDLCTEALNKERFAVLTLFAAGSPIDDRYRHLGPDEVEELFDEAIAELLLATYLFIISSCEARLRLDARKRVMDLGDPVGVRLKALLSSSAEPWMLSFPEDVLDSWMAAIRQDLKGRPQDADVLASRIGAIKPHWRLRHWVAHGRYFNVDHLAAFGQSQMAADVVIRLFAALNSHLGLMKRKPIL